MQLMLPVKVASVQPNTTTFSIMAMWAAVGITYIYVKNEAL